MLLILPCPQIEENHAQQDEQEVDGFAPKVLLAEEEGATEEGDDDTATAHHGDYGDECSVETE